MEHMGLLRHGNEHKGADMPPVHIFLAFAVDPRACAMLVYAKAFSVVVSAVERIIRKVRRGAAGEHAPYACPALGSRSYEI